MTCEYINKIIPQYLDNELSSQEHRRVKEHILSCPTCQKQIYDYQQMWQDLTLWPQVEPSANYVSRFWTELASRKPWYHPTNIFQWITHPRWEQAFAGLCVIIVFSWARWSAHEQTEKILASLEQEEMEIVEYLDLAENYEVIEDLDLFLDMEHLQELAG